MEYILNNEQLTVTFTTKGGTICSIEDSQELNISGKVMQRIGVGRHQYYFQSVVD